MAFCMADFILKKWLSNDFGSLAVLYISLQMNKLFLYLNW